MERVEIKQIRVTYQGDLHEGIMPYYIDMSDGIEDVPEEGPIRGEYDPSRKQLDLNTIPAINSSKPRTNVFGNKIKSFFVDSHRIEYENRILEQNQRSQRAMALIAQALKKSGVKSVTCTYDGGFDEGFAKLESVMTDKGTLAPAEACQFLVGSELKAPEFDPFGNLAKASSESKAETIEMNRKKPEQERVEEKLEIFVDLIAEELLGSGFGTGELVMMGKFLLELETGDIYDIEVHPAPDFRQEFGWVFEGDNEQEEDEQDDEEDE